jgi:2-keto-4-pentenoate hydratase/2-oxohepta-3-ene-1,7-dioic acid hydratase in catechol pathway
VGLNYDEHLRETKREKTEDPALFVRFANSQIGHLNPILLPLESSHLDFEGEIAVVIGTRGRGSRRSGPTARRGLFCYNDGSIRDLQWGHDQWDHGQELPGDGRIRPLARHHGRTPRRHAPHAGDPPERSGDGSVPPPTC